MSSFPEHQRLPDSDGHDDDVPTMILEEGDSGPPILEAKATLWNAERTVHFSDDEHSPMSPTAARLPPGTVHLVTNTDQSQHVVDTTRTNKFASLSRLDTKLAFPKPRRPRRSLPTPSKAISSPEDVPSPLMPILDGTLGETSIFARHPSLLAAAADEPEVLDSADIPKSYEDLAAEFLLQKRKAMENLWETIEDEPEERKKEIVTKSLTAQADIIDECFKACLRATKELRELKQDQAWMKKMVEEGIKSQKLVNELNDSNDQLRQERDELCVRLDETRERCTKLQRDLKTAEATLAESPTSNEPLDPERMAAWMEEEAAFYATLMEKDALPYPPDERPWNHTTRSRFDEDEDTPLTPTEMRRLRMKRKFHGIAAPKEVEDLMNLFKEEMAKRKDSLDSDSHTIGQLNQQIKSLQDDLDHERFLHGILAEDYERVVGEAPSFHPFHLSHDTEDEDPLRKLGQRLEQLKEELAETQERLRAEEKKYAALVEAPDRTAELQERIAQVSKDLAAQIAITTRLEQELSDTKKDLDIEKEYHEYAGPKLDRLQAQVEEQSAYIIPRDERWAQSAEREAALKKEVQDREADLHLERQKTSQFLERIHQLEDLEKRLATQLADTNVRLELQRGKLSGMLAQVTGPHDLIHDFKPDDSTSGTTIISLPTDPSALQSHFAHQEATIAAKDEAISQLHALLQVSPETHARLKEEIETCDVRLKQLLKSQADLLQDQKEYTDRIALLEQEINEARGRQPSVSTLLAHEQICFCSLVNYFFPNVLTRIRGLFGPGAVCCSCSESSHAEEQETNSGGNHDTFDQSPSPTEQEQTEDSGEEIDQIYDDDTRTYVDEDAQEFIPDEYPIGDEQRVPSIEILETETEDDEEYEYIHQEEGGGTELYGESFRRDDGIYSDSESDHDESAHMSSIETTEENLSQPWFDAELAGIVDEQDNYDPEGDVPDTDRESLLGEDGKQSPPRQFEERSIEDHDSEEPQQDVSEYYSRALTLSHGSFKEPDWTGLGLDGSDDRWESDELTDHSPSLPGKEESPSPTNLLGLIFGEDEMSVEQLDVTLGAQQRDSWSDTNLGSPSDKMIEERMERPETPTPTQAEFTIDPSAMDGINQTLRTPGLAFSTPGRSSFVSSPRSDAKDRVFDTPASKLYNTPDTSGDSNPRTAFPEDSLGKVSSAAAQTWTSPPVPSQIEEDQSSSKDDIAADDTVYAEQAVESEQAAESEQASPTDRVLEAAGTTSQPEHPSTEEVHIPAHDSSNLVDISPKPTRKTVHFLPISTDVQPEHVTTPRAQYPKTPAPVKIAAPKACVCRCHSSSTGSTRHYHGHTHATGSLFSNLIESACRLLTALTWMCLLILYSPNTLLSTTGMLAGYLFLPLRHLLQLAVYYTRLQTHRIRQRLSTHPPTSRPPYKRPIRPVLRHPTADDLVISAAFLSFAFMLLANQALLAERSLWTGPNRLRARYALGLLAGGEGPYPDWSPVEVDFRMSGLVQAVRWWCNGVFFGRAGWVGGVGEAAEGWLGFARGAVMEGGGMWMVSCMRDKMDAIGKALEVVLGYAWEGVLHLRESCRW